MSWFKACHLSWKLQCSELPGVLAVAAVFLKQRAKITRMMNILMQKDSRLVNLSLFNWRGNDNGKRKKKLKVVNQIK